MKNLVWITNGFCRPTSTPPSHLSIMFPTPPFEICVKFGWLPHMLPDKFKNGVDPKINSVNFLWCGPLFLNVTFVVWLHHLSLRPLPTARGPLPTAVSPSLAPHCAWSAPHDPLPIARSPPRVVHSLLHSAPRPRRPLPSPTALLYPMRIFDLSAASRSGGGGDAFGSWVADGAAEAQSGPRAVGRGRWEADHTVGREGESAETGGEA